MINKDDEIYKEELATRYLDTSMMLMLPTKN